MAKIKLTSEDVRKITQMTNDLHDIRQERELDPIDTKLLELTSAVLMDFYQRNCQILLDKTS